MLNSARYILILPAAASTAVAAWLGLGSLYWLATTMHHLPSHNGFSAGIVPLLINSVSAAAGVAAGARLAPARHTWVAVALVLTMLAFASVMLVLAAQGRVGAGVSFIWLVLSALSWIGGACLAAWIPYRMDARCLSRVNAG